MTWWLVAVCIDFSIVLTATVSSVPHQVMQEQRDDLRQKPESLKRVEVEGRSFRELLNTSSEENIKTVEFDDILPSADNVA